MAHPIAAEDLDLILRETSPLWEEMRGKRLFLTGGTGFFGCWLVESFVHINRALQLNAQVTILTRSPEAFSRKCPHLAADSAIGLLAGDVRGFEFPDGEFEYAIHAATDASAKQLAEDPLAMLSTILEGTAQVLKFAASHGTKKLLLTSSGAVYGPQPPGLTHVSEDFPGAPDQLDPASVYAEGKRASELIGSVYARTAGIEVKIARCYAFVGAHLPLDAHFAIGNFLADAMAGRTIRIGGDGTAMRSYLYGADLAIWLWTMLFRAPSMRAYNVGSDEAVTIKQLAETVVHVLNPGCEVHIAKAPTGAPPHCYVPSVERASGELSLRQTVSLEEAIRRTAAWYRIESNP
jgi:nucleoside-diphosphate-sugar epimerase